MHDTNIIAVALSALLLFDQCNSNEVCDFDALLMFFLLDLVGHDLPTNSRKLGDKENICSHVCSLIIDHILSRIQNMINFV